MFLYHKYKYNLHIVNSIFTNVNKNVTLQS